MPWIVGSLLQGPQNKIPLIFGNSHKAAPTARQGEIGGKRSQVDRAAVDKLVKLQVHCRLHLKDHLEDLCEASSAQISFNPKSLASNHRPKQIYTWTQNPKNKLQSWEWICNTPTDTRQQSFTLFLQVFALFSIWNGFGAISLRLSLGTCNNVRCLKENVRYLGFS